MGSSAGSTPTVRQPRQQRGGAGDAPSSSSSPVFLNVYDVTPANGYARWLGLGVYHSGVQVHGVEYAYGAHDGASSGIFEVVPRRCPGYTFRESVLVGATELSRAEVRALMSELAADFPGDAYNLVSRNCNHFCDAACRRLVARARIPRWINRLAKIGVVFTCVIPGNGRAAVRRGGECASSAAAAAGKGGVRSRSARQEACSTPAPPRQRKFFRSLSVGGRKNLTTMMPRPLSASPPTSSSSPPPPLAPASTSTSSGSTTPSADPPLAVLRAAPCSATFGRRPPSAKRRRDETARVGARCGPAPTGGGPELRTAPFCGPPPNQQPAHFPTLPTGPAPEAHTATAGVTRSERPGLPMFFSPRFPLRQRR